jgi:TctA family transporter
MVKSLMMAGVGLLAGMVGMDTMTGMPRFIFDVPDLFDGIDRKLTVTPTW